VKFRRKSADTDAAAEASTETEGPLEEADGEEWPSGPYDVDELPGDDATDRVDIGSLLVAPAEGLELRLQVDEETEHVQAVVLAGPEGALELRAFAAPRNGDLWSEVRPSWVRTVTWQSSSVPQPSRIIGVNGSRWMLRATLLGRPAQDTSAAAAWEDALGKVVVRRGAQAMPVGAELPLTLPPRDQLIERPTA
jgi:hypothetical protein